MKFNRGKIPLLNFINGFLTLLNFINRFLTPSVPREKNQEKKVIWSGVLKKHLNLRAYSRGVDSPGAYISLATDVGPVQTSTLLEKIYMTLQRRHCSGKDTRTHEQGQAEDGNHQTITQTDDQTNRQTDRQTDKHPDIQTDRPAHALETSWSMRPMGPWAPWAH